MFPTVVMVQVEVDLHKGTPFGSLGLADEVHAGFLRGAVRFAGIALDAGANDVFPRGGAAAVAGNDVVEVQVFALEYLAAVLAGVFVPFKNVVPREFHFFLGHAIEHDQQDDPRHANAEGDGFYGFGMRFTQREIVPLSEIVSAKGTVIRS